MGETRRIRFAEFDFIHIAQSVSAFGGYFKNLSIMAFYAQNRIFCTDFITASCHMSAGELPVRSIDVVHDV
jgi:hypothetical protein